MGERLLSVLSIRLVYQIKTISKSGDIEIQCPLSSDTDNLESSTLFSSILEMGEKDDEQSEIRRYCYRNISLAIAGNNYYLAIMYMVNVYIVLFELMIFL